MHANGRHMARSVCFSLSFNRSPIYKNFCFFFSRRRKLSYALYALLGAFAAIRAGDFLSPMLPEAFSPWVGSGPAGARLANDAPGTGFVNFLIQNRELSFASPGNRIGGRGQRPCQKKRRKSPAGRRVQVSAGNFYTPGNNFLFFLNSWDQSCREKT